MWYRIIKYLHFLYESKSKYKIHSPYLYDLVAHVMENKNKDETLLKINHFREQLKNTTDFILFEGWGANKTAKNHSLKYIENTISTPNRIASWYYHIIQRYNYKNIVELGTCIGIGTLYLANHEHTIVTTFEANKPSIHKANDIFKTFQLQNINLIEGPIENTLPTFINQSDYLDLIIMDANHTFDATIKYFEWILPKIHEQSMIIIDDIYWNDEMNKAWQLLANHPKVTLSLDFYRCGILLFAPNRVEKEHFKVWVND